jgi:hypothetical protein
MAWISCWTGTDLIPTVGMLSGWNVDQNRVLNIMEVQVVTQFHPQNPEYHTHANNTILVFYPGL